MIDAFVFSPYADAVDDADRDGDQVLEHAAELGADHVGVHEGAEVAVPGDAMHDLGAVASIVDETTAAVGCSFAISSARFGPEITAICDSCRSSSSCAMTSLMR